jgi:hypothetical protein
MTKFRVLLYAIAGALAPSLPLAAEPQHCVHSEVVLWGDGRHDDSAALNAWLRGADATWADSGERVGASIAGRSFRLSAAVYVTGGTGRRLENFRMLWPERGETVAGGTILAGADPEAAPILIGVSIEGGDPGEGKPFEAPDLAPADRPADRNDAASCGIS